MVYVDGPVHDFPDRQLRDSAKTTLLDDMDYTVLRFHHQDDWLSVTKRFPHVFGAGKSATATQSFTPDNNVREALDLDLFSDEWQEVFSKLSQRADLTIEPGADVQRDGRVIGAYVATISKQGMAFYVIDSSESSNSEVADQLQSENLTTIAIDPADSDAVQKIIAALEAT